MKPRWIVLTAVCFIVWLAGSGGAYWTNGPKWSSGSNIVMHLQMGSGSGTLIDGSTSWNAVSESALAIWNPYLSGVEFRVVRDSTSRIAFRNDINNVIWGDDVYGESFGDAVAITKWLTFTSDNRMAEADVVFDRGRSWNSYRGNLRTASGGGTLYDLRRVALHEFGHVLGLGHPDEHGQSVTALMNSRVSDLDGLQTDDTNGVRAIYDSVSSNHAPTVTASCNPCSVQAGSTSSLTATATDTDGDSLTYQWTATQGSFSSSTSANAVWTAPSQTGSVTATVTVQDGRSGSATATVTLQVVPRDTLQPGARLLPGQGLTSSNGRYRLLYQSDGNLVLYDDGDRTAPWASNTGGTSAGQAVMQGDGNFVLYNAQVVGIWGTGTAGNANARLVLQNDGNLVIYRSDGQPLWGIK